VSLASYVASRSDPERYPFTAIPVFTEKKFRHAFLYKHADAAIESPADLAGKTVAIESWDTAIGVWLRGIAREQYGLDLEAVTWKPRKPTDVPMDIPARFDVDAPPSDGGGNLERHKERFFAGEFDAAIDPAGPMFNAVMESDDAELVFDDPIEVEKEYFRREGIHPPMHIVAIRNEVLEGHPWVAERLFDAFCEARDRCLEWGRSPSSHVSLPWAHLHRHEARGVLGENIWEYGLTQQTRRELETFIEYADNQGLVASPLDPADLFVDATLGPR
jgi:4,5-dihydroxyphthalate decarboxylase